jgi:hypothetical protein
VEPVLPDGCMDIIWDGDRLFVAGPDTGPNQTGADGPFAVGVRFSPGSGLGFSAYLLTSCVTSGWLWIGCGTMQMSSQTGWPHVQACGMLPRCSKIASFDGFLPSGSLTRS